MNSRKLWERVRMYEKDGWRVDLDKNTLTRENKGTIWGTESRSIPPEGEYDPWYPLPGHDVDLQPNNPHQNMIDRVIELNKRISDGEIFNGIPCGDCPSAWIDHAGNARNKKLYEKALIKAREELANGQQLYRRVGSRFVKI